MEANSTKNVRIWLTEKPLPHPPERSIEGRVAVVIGTYISSKFQDCIEPTTTLSAIGVTPAQIGILRSALRIEFNINFPNEFLTDQTTVHSITAFVESAFANEQALDRECRSIRLHSSTKWYLLSLQLLPILILYPMRQSAQWTVQLWLLSRTRFWEEDRNLLLGRLASLVLSIVGAWASIELVFPLLGILAKWTIIGRYQEGLYPMWASYHTRWWMVEKIVSLCGMGLFSVNDHTKRWYCRLMGAKIGRRVRMTGVELGEWDLLDIRDDVTLTKCICRPFAAEKNSTMYLGRIVIGERTSIGVLSVIAPGTEVLCDTQMGANSSSWEQKDFSCLNLDGGKVSRTPEPHWLLSLVLTLPMYLVGWFISFSPSLCAQIGYIYKTPTVSDTPLRTTLNWFQSSPQVAFHYVAVMLQASLNPLLFFAFVVLVRRASIFFFGDLPADMSSIRGQFGIWRATLLKTIFPDSQFKQLNELLGQHHDARSWALRGLGARIGRRVCWPASGPHINDYHLLNIGNDVTIGSDCHLLTTDESSSGVVTIHDGAIVADHACVMPGVEVGEQTTLGFGTLTRRGVYYPAGTTFVGSQSGDVAHSDSWGHKLWALDNNYTRMPSAVYSRRRSSDETYVDWSATTQMEKRPSSGFTRYNNGRRILPFPHDTPFKRAFFKKKAPYHVFSPGSTLCFSIFMTVFTVFYWNVPGMSAMKIASRISIHHLRYLNSVYDLIVIYVLNTLTTVILTTSFAVLAVGAMLLAKRILIGKFQPGVYGWDTSPLYQRWQLLNIAEKLIRQCYVNRGILSLLTGTHWLVLYYRANGAKIGKDCALFASGSASLMITEPDLIDIGDRVVIDNAGIIPHIDRRDSIQLDTIKIGSRCVLRSGSNILSGVTMEEDSCLMEHTLVLPGDVVERDWVMQRQPAERFYGSRKGPLPKKDDQTPT